jgi:deoxyribonuclease-4
VAAQIGCQTIQIFSGNPMGWQVSRPSSTAVANFSSLLRQHDITPLFLHTPYLVNLASPEGQVWAKSRDALAAAVALAETLRAQYVVTHIGSHLGAGLQGGLSRVKEALAATLDQAEDGPTILLENSPGSRNEVGSYFEEIATILAGLAAHQGRLGVCLDTAHLWGAGYDLSSGEGVEATLAHFDALVGLERLHCIHANDSRLARGSRWDLHCIPGQGQIGQKGFQALVSHPRLAGMSYILEIPRVNDEECAPILARFKTLSEVPISR